MSYKSIKAGITEVIDIVATANGNFVGRTRLQKTACLLTLTGLSDHFNFVYKHYGPFSQELANAAEHATLFSDLSEVRRTTQWGGTYSEFSTNKESSAGVESPRRKIIEIAKEADLIELELAVTAAFLATQGFKAPWDETASRKPDKVADGRIARAKALYAKFREIETPTSLPKI